MSGSAARSGTAASSIPPRRITVNLAPADLRKAGASLDLAIAVGILLGSEQVRAEPVAGRSSASCRSAARCAPCPASCRWSRPWLGGAAAGRRAGRGGGRGPAGRRDRGAPGATASPTSSTSSGERRERRRSIPSRPASSCVVRTAERPTGGASPAEASRTPACRTWPTSAASARLDGRSRSRSPAVTGSC